MKYLTHLLALFIWVSFAFTAFGQTNIGFDFYGGGSVTSTTVGTAGTGYTSPPTVAFTGGSGAIQAIGTSTLKVVGTPTVTAGGTGYAVGNVLTVVGGTRTTAATLTVSTVSSGVITAVTVSNAGVYTAIPTNAVAVTGGAGTGATFTLGYGVGTIVLTSSGTGYLTAPTIAFSGGAGSGAAATATLDSAATGANAVKFYEIMPQTDSVISAITFPDNVPADDTETGARRVFPYQGDRSIIGKTLTAGRVYRIFGNSVTFSSGTGYLSIRPN